MVNERPQTDENEAYEFRILGELDPCWSEWFEGLAVRAADGETILYGCVRDQAELYGILDKFRNLGLVLLSVNLASETASDRSPEKR